MQNCFIVSALQHGRRENPLSWDIKFFIYILLVNFFEVVCVVIHLNY